MDSTSSPRAVSYNFFPARPEPVEGYEWENCSFRRSLIFKAVLTFLFVIFALGRIKASKKNKNIYLCLLFGIIAVELISYSYFFKIAPE
jgi:hypothetical protein